jgi:hypothetical protein
MVRFKEIKGHCPVCKIGDTFTLKYGYRLITEILDQVSATYDDPASITSDAFRIHPFV